MDSPKVVKNKAFAKRIRRMYDYLVARFGHCHMFNQVYRSGTSIGALIAESVFAQSRADFFNKMQVSLKAANETRYWLEQLYEAQYLTKPQFESMRADCSELIAILVSIIKHKDDPPKECL